MNYIFLIILQLTILLNGCSTHQLRAQDGTSLPILLNVYPLEEAKTAPTILIAHGSDGVQDFHKEWATRIQSWGYNAVIVDHYSLRAINRHTGQLISGVRGEDRARDLVQVGHWIMKQRWHEGKIGVIGFSQGGGGVFALTAAQKDVEHHKIVDRGEKIPFSAAVSFYPACSLSPPPIKPSVPTQVHIASNDTLVLLSACSPLDDSLYEVHKYNGATHAFDVVIPSTAKLTFLHRYDPVTAKVSQAFTKTFLDRNLK